MESTDFWRIQLKENSPSCSASSRATSFLSPLSPYSADRFLITWGTVLCPVVRDLCVGVAERRRHEAGRRGALPPPARGRRHLESAFPLKDKPLRSALSRLALVSTKRIVNIHSIVFRKDACCSLRGTRNFHRVKMKGQSTTNFPHQLVSSYFEIFVILQQSDHVRNTLFWLSQNKCRVRYPRELLLASKVDSDYFLYTGFFIMTSSFLH